MQIKDNIGGSVNDSNELLASGQVFSPEVYNYNL